MTIERKVGMGIAGQPSGGAADVAEVFSTHLYAGNAGSQTITNGIDLAGEGGMVWFKRRNGAVNHVIFDTERWTASSGNGLFPNLTNAAGNINELTGFNSNGFGVTASGYINDSYDMASWTFRKKEKFFDVVTWTGDSSEDQTISHNLNSSVGLIITKKTNASGHWHTFHISKGNGGYGALNANDQFGTGAQWGVTNTTFNADGGLANNATGDTYVAYLFADNSSEDADDQMIKCGSYTGNGSVDGPEINLGWEPQWIIIKRSTAGAPWLMYDSMRGIDALITADHDGAENSIGGVMDWVDLQATGFKIKAAGGHINENTNNYIYMAIRAPMMVEPSAATDVFAVSTEAAFSSDRLVSAGFAVDAAISAQTGSSGAPHMTSRLTAGTWLSPDETSAEGSGNYWLYDESLGVKGTNAQYGSVTTVWNMWKRAKGYMDAVAYTGNATTGRTVPHSLSVIPEMIWVKRRSASSRWSVLHKDLTNALKLNEDIAATAGNYITATSSTNFTVTSNAGLNAVNETYIAYLFATLAGISKVGNFVGNGSSQTISCGFSAGSRYILIKRTDAVGDWYVWDSARGIVAGNDPHLSLNSNTAQVTTDDSVDPANSGFIVNQVSATNINVSSGTYIFYAIA